MSRKAIKVTDEEWFEIKVEALKCGKTTSEYLLMLHRDRSALPNVTGIVAELPKLGKKNHIVPDVPFDDFPDVPFDGPAFPKPIDEVAALKAKGIIKPASEVETVPFGGGYSKSKQTGKKEAR